MDAGQEVDGELVVAGRQAAEVLQPAKLGAKVLVCAVQTREESLSRVEIDPWSMLGLSETICTRVVFAQVAL